MSLGPEAEDKPLVIRDGLNAMFSLVKQMIASCSKRASYWLRGIPVENKQKKMDGMEAGTVSPRNS